MQLLSKLSIMFKKSFIYLIRDANFQQVYIVLFLQTSTKIKMCETLEC